MVPPVPISATFEGDQAPCHPFFDGAEVTVSQLVKVQGGVPRNRNRRRAAACGCVRDKAAGERTVRISSGQSCARI
jgi:hypothetical protein